MRTAEQIADAILAGMDDFTQSMIRRDWIVECVQAGMDEVAKNLTAAAATQAGHDETGCPGIESGRCLHNEMFAWGECQLRCVMKSACTKIQKDRDWAEYQNGTKAHALGGGYWIKCPGGWKWFNGSIFPTPGADAIGKCIELPEAATSKDHAS